jgi:hypothetical protein
MGKIGAIRIEYGIDMKDLLTIEVMGLNSGISQPEEVVCDPKV